METELTPEHVAELRKSLEQLHQAIATAVREGDIRRDVRLTLKACQLRRELVAAQASMPLPS